MLNTKLVGLGSIVTAVASFANKTYSAKEVSTTNANLNHRNH